MKPRKLFGLVVGGVLAAGCGSGKGLPPLSGSGGTGGAPSGVGGSTRAVGGSTGRATGGAAEGAPDGAVCEGLGSLRSIPWRLVLLDAGTSTPPPGADAATSGCQGTGSGYSWDGTCSGAAWLRPGGGLPTVTWDDGSQMLWNATPLGEPLTPPAVGTGDTRVWASFTSQYRVICPVCGATSSQFVEIRENAGGKLLFLGQTGPNLQDPGAEQLMALFGVPADTRALCSRNNTDRCTQVLLTINDHLVHTVPAQVIPPSSLAAVIAPNGTIQVYWTSAFEQQQGAIPGCVDGTPTGPWTTFVGSRVAAAAAAAAP